MSLVCRDRCELPMTKQGWAGIVLVFCVALGPIPASDGPSIAAAQTTAPKALAPLDQLLAPVALYPDALLAQVLTSATSPGQVTEMNKWLQQNQQLQGTQLQEAAQQKGFDASFIALALFPDVLNLMSSQIGWTTELGTAFLSDPKGVMESVQRLRAQAKAAGNLKSTPQQSVNTESQNGQQIIVIQPANPQVVYVPVYNPQVVYYPPPPDAAAVLVGFGLGIAIGAAMSNNTYNAPYGWGAWGMGWHTHTVVVRGGAWAVPPHAGYPYVRPVPMPYGGYRPNPYVYAPTTINVTKINVNGPVYAGGVTPRPTPYTPVARPPTAVPPAPRPGTVPPRPTTYSGASATQTPRPATGSGASATQTPRPATGSGASATQTPRPATGSGASATQTPRPATGSGARPASPPAAAAQRPAPSSTPGMADYGSRGYGSPSNVRPNERAQTSSSAFTGYQSGSAERAASQRGQGSLSLNKKARAPGSSR
jgi:uncharacterized protein DUF3300